jgi:hypothetical protein
MNSGSSSKCRRDTARATFLFCPPLDEAKGPQFEDCHIDAGGTVPVQSLQEVDFVGRLSALAVKLTDLGLARRLAVVTIVWSVG